VVHRCAYLLRVERVPAQSILILCFNRNAAVSLRRRLYELVGEDARGVMVQTYHGLAMRLSGLSFAESLDHQKQGDDVFDQVIVNATRLLKGELDLPGLANDEVRERLLAGFRFILVDEYQDIDEDQYELISALAGRAQADSDSKLAILAVGDDDQNIYASFRHTSVRFIRRFQEDYQAKVYHLVENYRSTAHIIAAANCLIAHNSERMKQAHPITINHGRRPLPPGGSWESLDPVAKGKVQLYRVADRVEQTVALVAEIHRLRQRNPSLYWEEVAVLARTHEELVPIRALLEEEAIPVCWTEDREKLPPVFRVREIALFLDHLRQRRHEFATAEQLREGLEQQRAGQSADPWGDLLRGVLDAWRIESHNAELPVDVVREFICDALLEYRRDPARGHGVYLGTVHGAKGMEFGHVFIPGGGWTTTGDPNGLEEERRVYYVGMTRAMETLCLFELRKVPHPHAKLLRGPFLCERDFHLVAPPDPTVLARGYIVLGMRDIDLGFAGRKSPEHPIHRRLAELQVGSCLRMESHGEGVALINDDGNCVARLSKSAVGEWKNKLSLIQTVKVIAMVWRHREDGDQEFSQYHRCESWELPLVEVTYQLPRVSGS
jgi:ATP-dependent DNA helicase RecQ